MREKVNVTKTEMLLLGLTAVFLCGLLALSHHDRARTPGVTVETAVEVPQEELTPDFAPLDLNTAPAEELAKLPGIGEALAERIVSYREEHGPFGAVEDVMNVSGIGEKKLEGLQDRVTVTDGGSGNKE